MRIQIARKATLLILTITVLNIAVKTNNVISNEQPVQLKWSYKFANETGDVAMSSDGKFIIVGGYPGSLFFFNTSEASEPLWSFNVSTGYVNSLSISSDGKFVAAGSEDGVVYFFDLFFDKGGLLFIPWWIWWVLGIIIVRAVAAITAVLWTRKHFRMPKPK